MIVVTGATGALNGATAQHLSSLVATTDIAVAVRDVDKASGFADRGIDVLHGDYAEPASLAAAFDGAHRLLLVSSNDPSRDTVGLHRTAIEAAAAAGVERVYYTSHQGASHDSPFVPCRVHAATEDLLADSGLAWTSLRNGFYAHTLEWLLGPWRETGTMVIPADGPVSWTARADSAEVAAVVLASDATYDGPITITAGTAPTVEDLAAMATDLVGRRVESVVVDPDRWVADRMADGMPAGAARFTLGIFEAANGGFFAGTDPLLTQLLGRDPRPVREVLAHHGTM
ncbi:NmrA family transcriptional regulator [Rhodococcoides trifolii]|uniref:NmrA family transcriptional regulator n=1 Tax=Rhodococcoides trifolii TaxID=908250 RepID=A0A917G2G4_9NOCA|nr:NAD(P)H-binding protein [Rhodococcus trifolii]GGG19833.1 NmrA family transcriptional regulator [Rhodococcus trifolii]